MVTRKLAILITALCVCACGAGKGDLLDNRSPAEFSAALLVTGLEDGGSIGGLTLEPDNGEVNLAITGARELKAAYVEIEYDPSVWR